MTPSREEQRKRGSPKCARQATGRCFRPFVGARLVEVSEQDVECKVAALAEYKTYANKYYFDPSITRATMIRHGALAERPFAEGFDILRIVGMFGRK